MTTQTPPFVEIDGVPCYAPDVARSHDDYPAEGFDVTVDVEARSFWCRSRIRILRAVLAKYADLGRRQDLLEIGCGTGSVVASFASLGPLTLTGSEVYLSGLRHAKARHPAVSFIQLDATRMPFDAAFDIVGAFDVLEHIDEDERVIANVVRALRPSGMFVITVPQHPWMWSQLDELVHHKRRYTRADLRDKLERAGLRVEFMSSFVTTLFPAMAAMRLLGKLRGKPADVKQAFAAEVTLPETLNAICDRVMRIDEALVARGVSLPFGGSLLAVARKP